MKMSGSPDKQGKNAITSKSSLEIISELFSTFNAEPPVIVKKEKFDEGSKKHKKSKKKHKHKKHKKKSKKHKRSRSNSSESDSDASGVDLTEILIKREIVKSEPEDNIKIKSDPDISKLESTKKQKTDQLKNQSESSSCENDSDDSPELKDSKYSSIFHVALQTLKEREKLKLEQVKYKRKHLEENVAVEKKMKTESDSANLNAQEDSLVLDNVKNEHTILSSESKIPKSESTLSEAITANIPKSDSRTSENLEEKRSNDKVSTNKNELHSKDPRKSSSSYSKSNDKNDSTSKRKISPIVFKSDDIANDSKHRESNKRKESESTRSRDRAREKDQDKNRSKDSYHRDEGTGSRRHKEPDHKHRRKDRHHNDDNDFYRRKDESSRSSRKRSRSANRNVDTNRVTGFSQGNLVSTRLGNPFYLKTPGDRGNMSFGSNSRSPPSMRSSHKEDRWSIRERFRREASSSSSITIDKKKLLEIARKNAVQMIKSGSLPEALKLGPQAQEKVLAAIRSGGKTVDELTDFCRTLSCKEEMGELSSLSDGEQRSDGHESDTEQPFHHPFQLKERPQSITMNIKNSVPLPIKSTTERATELRLQFPVSSGQLHRKTESEWTPVEPTVMPIVDLPQIKPKKVDVTPATPKSVTLAAPIPSAPSPSLLPQPPLPHAPPLPIPHPSHTLLPVSFTTRTVSRVITVLSAPPLPPLPPPSPPHGLMYMAMGQTAQMPVPQPLIVPPQPPIPGAPDNLPDLMAIGQPVFPSSEQIAEQEKVDVATIVSQRLTAMRKLQENPNDVQAITEIYKAQKEMNFWAECKQQFGQFTGSTGAQIMSQAELNSGYQAWARRDQLQTAAPVTGGMGMHLLQKMGWRPGEGLGKEKTGTLEPLLLEVKLDKKGVVAKEEIKGGRGPSRAHVAAKNAPSSVKQAVKVLQGKHPVSLLSEYASKKHFSPPEYSLCFECGPDHKKNFVFKVLLNGLEYKPNIACGNKKEAKALSATICLQQIGMLPHVPTAQHGPM